MGVFRMHTFRASGLGDILRYAAVARNGPLESHGERVRRWRVCPFVSSFGLGMQLLPSESFAFDCVCISLELTHCYQAWFGINPAPGGGVALMEGQDGGVSGGEDSDSDSDGSMPSLVDEYALSDASLD